MKPTESAPIRALCIAAAFLLPLTALATVSFTDPLVRQTANWTESFAGTGPSITFANGRMLQSFPADSVLAATNNCISAVYAPNFRLIGDFDAQVDYEVDPYTPSPRFQVSGLRASLAFNMTSAERVGWENLGYDVYLANHYWNFTTVPTHDVSGSLRLVRQGDQISSYYKSKAGWQLLSKSRAEASGLGPAQTLLSSGFPGYAFPGMAMNVAFSNFKVTADDIAGLQSELRNPPQTALAAIRKQPATVSAQPSPASVSVLSVSEAASSTASSVASSTPPSLEIKWSPALSLTGDVGSSYSIEYTEAVGSTNAWIDLTTITLTNNPQIYFDSSAIGQPSRYYRLKKVP